MLDDARETLDFLAKMIVQIPAPREQTVRYFGYYSNKSRGQRKKIVTSGEDASKVLPAKKSSVRWARLIAKVYLVDPLCCPKCQGQMKIISFIEEDTIIAQMLKPGGLMELPCGHSPPAKAQTVMSVTNDDGYDLFDTNSSQPDYDHCQLLPEEYEFEAC